MAPTVSRADRRRGLDLVGCRSRSPRSGCDADVCAIRTVALVPDVDLLPQHCRLVLVVLQDGRQIEGELIALTGRYEVGSVVFEAWAIEELEDVT